MSEQSSRSNNESEQTTSSLIIRRQLIADNTATNSNETARALIKVECKAGYITVLSDKEGHSVKAYESAFLNQAADSKIEFELGSSKLKRSDYELIGFKERNQSELSIAQFLEHIGFNADEIHALISHYELNKVSHLLCSQLPNLAERQVLLLAASRTKLPLIVLNDPFQPFNGRWREAFALLLLERALKGDCAIICMNLSFLPQSWVTQERVKRCDIGALERRALERANEELQKLRAQSESTHTQSSAAKLATTAPNCDQAPSNHEQQLSTQSKQLLSAYQITSDYIFQPLADIANMFRRHAFIGSLAAFCGLIITGSLIMYPNLTQSRELLSKLTKDIEWNWSDLFGSRQQREQNIESTILDKTKPLESNSIVESKDQSNDLSHTESEQDLIQMTMLDPLAELMQFKSERKLEACLTSASKIP